MPLKLRLLLPAALAAVASACQPPAPSAEQNEARMLSGCGETERLLGQMKAAEGSFRYDQVGNASISTAVWLALPEELRDGLVKAIAYHAVCAQGELREQEVTVRSAESSDILVERTVTDFDR